MIIPVHFHCVIIFNYKLKIANYPLIINSKHLKKIKSKVTQSLSLKENLKFVDNILLCYGLIGSVKHGVIISETF